jgi:hypothetical protein
MDGWIDGWEEKKERAAWRLADHHKAGQRTVEQILLDRNTYRLEP